MIETIEMNGAANVRAADTSAADTSAPMQKQDRLAKLRPMLHTMFVDVLPPLAAFYGFRAAGASQYLALLAGAIVAGIPVLYEIVKSRRLDPFAGYLMLIFGLGLAVALTTDNPQLILAGQTGVNGIIAVVFLVSCAVGKPLTEIAAARMTAGKPPAPENALATVHKIHLILSLMWGFGLLAEVAARLVIIFTMPFDAANGIVSVVSTAALAALGVLSVLVVRVFVKKAKAGAQPTS